LEFLLRYAFRASLRRINKNYNSGYQIGYQINKDFSPGSERRTLRPQVMYDTTYLIRLFFKRCCNFTLLGIDILEQNLKYVVPCIRRTSQTRNSSLFLY